jgi:hypothetical protein
VIALTLKEQLKAQHIRITAPDRPCDRCRELPPAGETLQIATIRFSAASVAFSICDHCVAAELERFKDHTMSHDAAAIFTCHQEPEGLNKLSAELVQMNEWISQNSARCDECSQPLVAGEPISTVAAPLTGAISSHQILHVVCPSCATGTTPRIKANCKRFVGRLVSNRATAFIKDLIDTKKVTVN